MGLNLGYLLKPFLLQRQIPKLTCQLEFNTYLFLLFVKIINDDTNKQIEGKEGSKNDEKDKVEVHVDVDFTYGLLSQLKRE